MLSVYSFKVNGGLLKKKASHSMCGPHKGSDRLLGPASRSVVGGNAW